MPFWLWCISPAKENVAYLFTASINLLFGLTGLFTWQLPFTAPMLCTCPNLSDYYLPNIYQCHCCTLPLSYPSLSLFLSLFQSSIRCLPCVFHILLAAWTLFPLLYTVQSTYNVSTINEWLRFEDFFSLMPLKHDAWLTPLSLVLYSPFSNGMFWCSERKKKWHAQLSLWCSVFAVGWRFVLWWNQSLAKDDLSELCGERERTVVYIASLTFTQK